MALGGVSRSHIIRQEYMASERYVVVETLTLPPSMGPGGVPQSTTGSDRGRVEEEKVHGWEGSKEGRREKMREGEREKKGR